MAGQRTRRRIPEATVARLPIYLKLLSDQFDVGTTNISSEELAELGGVNAAKVRKDLSYLGSYGTRGVGYDVEFLIFQIKRELGLTHDWDVVIVGAGHLGKALAGYGGFGERGFPVGGVVDIDPSKIGGVVGGVRVRHVDQLTEIVQTKEISIGVIATPGQAAQSAADSLVAAGITSILNFAPNIINVPHGISVRKVDLAVELQILSYHEQRRVNARRVTKLQAVPGNGRRGASA
ncbi:redox-sensing transcriptional repressor Rex [Ilumatobacter nonamiensis]|uniref:redox-sensing transcriptional repressor Rex n=1 Tax=Ilumatobacter nonamiensis TaxID=467093 RepID=UPI00034747ED|nr:redox-sensing transcriptional repressor Rex [Ilumatobacter nonamiensis]